MIHTRRLCGRVILVFLACFIPVTAGHAVDIDAAPLFSYESQGDAYTFRALGPILEFSEQASAVRPFYHTDRETSRTEILYPLGSFSRERSMFVPFYRSTGDQGDHPHTEFFPVFSGRYKDKAYGGVFPLYGTMYHRFGLDEARFVLWPLYSETRLGDSDTCTVLWPVFSYSEGRLLRVFPLYGQEHKPDDSSSAFFLWPVFLCERGPDRKMDAVLPLFRYARGATYRNISVLWPFFSYNRDFAAGHTSADFPWPLVRAASGAYEETRVFPLYWSKTEGSSYSMKTVLWPVWFSRSHHYEDTGTDEKTVSVLLVNRVSEKTTRDGQTHRRVILWPFLYTSREGSKSEWHFPAIFPLFFDKGFASTWGPVLSLAEGTADKDLASARTSILWRTISWEKTGDKTKWSVSFLASSTRTPGERQWGFLGNLLSFRQDTAASAP